MVSRGFGGLRFKVLGVSGLGFLGFRNLWGLRFFRVQVLGFLEFRV